MDDLVEATLEKTILKRTILKKKPIPFRETPIPFSIKRENVNNFVKQIDEIHQFSPTFVFI